MNAVLILIIVIVAGGIVAYVLQLLVRRNTEDNPSQPQDATADATAADNTECCGLHAVCEKLNSDSAAIEYFDDEELDEMAGIDPDKYTAAQVEQFREVLTTLADGEIADWLRSLRQRHIAVPDDLRDEVLMLVEDAAASPTAAPPTNI